MPGVIKAGDDATITAFGRAEAKPPAPEKPAVELALEEAHEEIAALQAALLVTREAGAKAERTAHAAGRREGLAEAEAEHARRTEQVTTALEEARAAWDERLAGLNALAVMLARAALGRVFDAPADVTDLIARTIAKQIATLRIESVVAIHVSALDFLEDDARAALGAQAGTASTTIVADPALKSGDCRIDLQLGHIDCGIATQWRELRAFLYRLETPS